MKKSILFIIYIIACNTLYSQSSITFTTTKSIGENLSLMIHTNIDDYNTIWIDLNNNRIKEINEEITKFNQVKEIYTIQSQTITVYGNVTQFDCTSNNISTLNISQNPQIANLNCSDNELTSLNLANLNNTHLVHLNASNNPKLSCIEIDNAFTPTDLWIKDAIANWSISPCPQYIPVNSFIVYADYFDLDKQAIDSLIYLLSPTNATFDSIIWQSTDPSIVSIDDKCRVKGLSLGKASIIATTYDGAFSDTCKITVVEPQAITFTTTKAIGDEITLALYSNNLSHSNNWIDLNNNGIKEESESKLIFNKSEYVKREHNYTLNSQTISIY